MLPEKPHEYYMKKALEQAEIAYEKGELPIGAVVVYNQQIIAKTHNQTEQLNDFTAHAEMISFTSASEYFGNKYLDKCSIYVTLEPCMMCAGAAFWTRIGKVIYGASDPKNGFTTLSKNPLLNKQEVTSGIMANECEELLKKFFQEKRTK